MKIVLSIFLAAFLISGCSKENKQQTNDIKIEQQNPPKELPKETPKEEVKDTAKTIEQNSVSNQKNNSSIKQEAVNLKPKQTANYIGKNAVVTGYVADVYKNEKVAYLNFDGKFPKNSCAAVIFKDDFSKFGDLSRFKNKTIEVSGIISEYNGKPQIILKNSSQVKITN
jgi:glucan-binding YG repeat protein